MCHRVEFTMIGLWSFLALLLVSLCPLAVAEPVHLGVSKEIINEYVFERKELSILYTVFNLHSSRSAHTVELMDSYPDSEFIQIHGSQSVRWPSIPASSNVSHAVVVIPRKSGPYNFTSATITYLAGDDDKTTLLYSSAPGLVMIHPIKEYNRRFATHTIEWIGFAMIVTPCLLIPYMLWYSSASKYL
ncbi:Translocon-associated protein subunit beta [Fasciola gigantica]|uniref:Translocon-associated protein subunit beta n=1 Tax=Fasciola gigantica TaxID=46835 RepID=A0A504YAM3_FASGI|nr:Translocon-associated protein subunit beta [Fasciola gigantica]